MAGRPTDYKEEYNELVYKFCLLGATDIQLSEFLGICESTLNNWKNDYPEFLASIKKGKDIADAEVGAALFHRATGYSHPEDKIFNDGGEPLVVPTIKHYPPDPTSIIFWLKNRQKDKWRDIKATEHTGAGGGPVQVQEVQRTIVDPKHPDS